MAHKRHHSSKHHSKHSGGHERDLGHDAHKEMSRHHSYKDGMRAMHEGGHMIHDDRSQPANLPSGVIDKYYDNEGYGLGGSINDLYMGVSKQMKEDRSDLNRELSPGKY